MARRHPPAKARAVEREQIAHVVRGIAAFERRRDDLIRRLRWRWKWIAAVAGAGWGLAAALAIRSGVVLEILSACTEALR